MLKERCAVFTGVARNCAQHLPGVLDNLACFAAHYGSTRFLFAVSDSDDGSCERLNEWLAKDGRIGRAVDLGTLADRLTRRTERIAYARNAALDAIRRSGWADGWADDDHLVVVDLDDVLAHPVPPADFERAALWLDAEPARVGVLANAWPRYYDVWALRHERWCPDDCWQPIWNRDAQESFAAAKFREVFARQIVLPPTLPPIAVRSAFGGLGIYRLGRAMAARYCGLDRQGRETSEHVAFNAAIVEGGGELHIFPALRVRAPTQHLYDAAEFTWRWRITMQAHRLVEAVRPPWRRLLSP